MLLLPLALRAQAPQLTPAQQYADSVQRADTVGSIVSPSLPTPNQSIETTVEYQPLQNTYLLRNKIGELDIESPYLMNAEEYKKYQERQFIRKYWQQKISEVEHDNEKKFDQCTVRVIERATGIKLDQTGTVDLAKGKTLTLKATVEPSTTTDKVVFTDDGSGFATVDSKTGVVTGVAIGKTVITATAGTKKATVTINVVRAPMEKVTGVKYSLNGDKSIKVEWARESTGYGDWYWLFCKQGSTEVFKKQTQNLTETIPADKLKSGQVYQITVQATHGQDQVHLTGDDEYEEGPVSDAVSLNY